jgi:hypothetical protein
MSQHDYVVANQSFPDTRTDLNNAFQALASTNIGSSAPSTLYSGQIWIDSTTATAWQPKIYDGAAWINLPFYINTATNDANLTTTEVTSLVVESDPQAVALAIALG